MSCRSLDLETSWGRLRLIGGSRAGEGTLLMLPQLRLALDAGRPHRKLPGLSTLFISHGHADHLDALAFWASQRALNRMGHGRLLAPKEIAADLRLLLQTHARMEGERDYDIGIHPLEAGSIYQLRSGLRMEFFRTPHRIPTLGCRIILTRKHLRPEFQGLPDGEIRAMNTEGREITASIDIPILAYAADTGAEIFEHPEFLEAEILLLECSFWGEDDRDRARRFAHLHIDDILEHLPALSFRHLVLLHASRRTRLGEINSLIDTRFRPRTEAAVHHMVVEWD